MVLSFRTAQFTRTIIVGLAQMVLKGVWWRIKNPTIRRFLHRTLYMSKRAGFVCEVVAKFNAKKSIYLCNSSKINVVLPRYHCRLFFPWPIFLCFSASSVASNSRGTLFLRNISIQRSDATNYQNLYLLT